MLLQDLLFAQRPARPSYHRHNETRMKFVLEPEPQPTVVRHLNAKNLLSTTVHLTDSGTATLCGLAGHLVLTPKGTTATCKKCLTAKDGESRFERIIK